nr:hypothetical protein BaRGS_009765 [Batillaria attramentaria]
MDNPDMDTPDMDNPDMDTPDMDNPDMDTPDMGNPDLDDKEDIDVTLDDDISHPPGGDTDLTLSADAADTDGMDLHESTADSVVTQSQESQAVDNDNSIVSTSVDSAVHESADVSDSGEVIAMDITRDQDDDAVDDGRDRDVSDETDGGGSPENASAGDLRASGELRHTSSVTSVENNSQPDSPDYSQPDSPDYSQPDSPDYSQPDSPDYSQPDSLHEKNTDGHDGSTVNDETPDVDGVDPDDELTLEKQTTDIDRPDHEAVHVEFISSDVDVLEDASDDTDLIDTDLTDTDLTDTDLTDSGLDSHRSKETDVAASNMPADDDTGDDREGMSEDQARSQETVDGDRDTDTEQDYAENDVTTDLAGSDYRQFGPDHGGNVDSARSDPLGGAAANAVIQSSLPSDASHHSHTRQQGDSDDRRHDNADTSGVEHAADSDYADVTYIDSPDVTNMNSPDVTNMDSPNSQLTAWDNDGEDVMAYDYSTDEEPRDSGLNSFHTHVQGGHGDVGEDVMDAMLETLDSERTQLVDQLATRQLEKEIRQALVDQLLVILDQITRLEHNRQTANSTNTTVTASGDKGGGTTTVAGQQTPATQSSIPPYTPHQPTAGTNRVTESRQPDVTSFLETSSSQSDVTGSARADVTSPETADIQTEIKSETAGSQKSSAVSSKRRRLVKAGGAPLPP